MSTIPKIAYIKWMDACAEEATWGSLNAVSPGLCELHEVGFLLAENDEVVTIGMEQEGDGETQPGRWRLHIPKSQIKEMRVVDLEKAFKRRRKA